MRIIKRWTTGIVSKVDWMVGQVENHEALVNNALRQARESTARAKVQLNRVRRDGEELRGRINSEGEMVERWRERAKSIAESDEKSAVECLRRSKRSEQLVAQLRIRMIEHEKAEQQLSEDVRKMEEQLSELIEKRNLMRTRQSRAEAVCSVSNSSNLVSCDLDDVFERWESRVAERELGSSSYVDIDTLEQSFLKSEEEESLRDELKSLTGSND